MNTCSVRVQPQNWWRPLLTPLTLLTNPSSSRLSNFNHLCKFFPRWLTVPIPSSDIWWNCYIIEIFQVFKLSTTQNDTLNGTQNCFLAFPTLFSERFFFFFFPPFTPSSQYLVAQNSLLGFVQSSSRFLSQIGPSGPLFFFFSPSPLLPYLGPCGFPLTSPAYV